MCLATIAGAAARHKTVYQSKMPSGLFEPSATSNAVRRI